MTVDDLPLPVVTLLNVVGVPWPYLNEDTIHQFGTLVRDFGQAVERTHRDATDAVAGIARSYQGPSTRKMQSGWTKLSARHVDEIVTGCDVLADALDVAAIWIVAEKVEALVTLVGLAAAFIADQAAAVATFGLAEAAVPVLIQAARVLLETLKQQIIQYIMGKIIEAAAKPLFARIEQSLAGLDWGSGGDPGASVTGTGFALEQEVVGELTSTLRGHAAAMATHAVTLRTGLAGLDF